MHLFRKVNEKIISIKSVRNDDKVQIVEFRTTEQKILLLIFQDRQNGGIAECLQVHEMDDRRKGYPSSVQTSFRNDGRHGS